MLHQVLSFLYLAQFMYHSVWEPTGNWCKNGTVPWAQVQLRNLSVRIILGDGRGVQ